MIVADASVIVDLLLRRRAEGAIRTRLFRDAESVHVPALLDLEVAHAFRRYVLRGELSVGSAKSSLAVLSGIPMHRHTHEPLMKRIWQLRDNFTAYDAAYVALAEGLDATLITCDARLAHAPGMRARVELIGQQ